jgi:hypothetical protein
LPGGWILRGLARLRIPAYRCRACRHRFSEPAGNISDVTSQLEMDAFLTFLRPADNRSFEEVIRDLAREEQEQTNERLKAVRKLEGVSADGQSRW